MTSRRKVLQQLSSTLAIGGLVSGCGGTSAGAAALRPPPPSGKIVLELGLTEGSGNTASEAATSLTYPITNALATGRYGDPKGPAWKSGKAIGASCLRFDGYSTLIRVRALAPKALEAGVTVSAWVAPYAFEWGDAPDSPRLSALVSQADLDRAAGLVFGLYRHGTWGVSLGNGLQMPTLLVARDADRVRRNAWSHIAFTYDPASQRVRFFKNGREVLSGQVSIGKPVMPKTDLQIGRHSDALGTGGVFKFNSYAGLANHVRMHDYALEDHQIKAMVEADLLSIGGRMPELGFDDVDIGPAYLATDRHRPAFHAQPNFGWMNEPHAPIYHNGKYHLFYQKNPFGPFWHQIHWGHWVSDDMVHWSEIEMALAPTDDGKVTTNIRPTSPSYAELVAPDGIWSGSATHDRDGNPILVFTAGNDSRVPSQAVGIATAADPIDPMLGAWNIHPTPIIIQAAGVGIAGEFRDPFVFFDKTVGKYFALVTSGTRKSGTALVYESLDLFYWDYRGPLFESDLVKYPQTGAIWELPVLLPVGENADGEARWAFFVNAHGKGAKLDVYYWLGRWDPVLASFAADAEAPRVFDCGEGYFTGPSGFVDPKSGRSILFSIAQGARNSQFDYDSGWAHSAGMPLEVKLGDDADLHVRPIREIDSLRGDPLFVGADLSLKEANVALKNLAGNRLDIEVEIAEGAQIGVSVHVHPDGLEHTDIVFDSTDSRFFTRRDKSSTVGGQSDVSTKGGQVHLASGPLTLRVLVDGSLIESYLNDKYSLTTRAYPALMASNGLALLGAEDLQIKRIVVYSMKPIAEA